jgi:hypothetical protein
LGGQSSTKINDLKSHDESVKIEKEELKNFIRMTKFTTLTGNQKPMKREQRPRAYTDMHDLETQNQMMERMETQIV